MGQPKHHNGDWRVKLVLHYDGRNFFGWQVQRNRRTVQGELSNLLSRVCAGSRSVVGAGRTDRGVHASGQVASALIPDRFDPTELRRALNALSPPDLWIAEARRVPLDFHPRHDAISRTYVYRVGVEEETASPFFAPWCWPVGRPLALEPMATATDALLGAHDFGGFAKSGQPDRGTRCRVEKAGWRESHVPGHLDFEISANRYLHRMVRYLVSTLVEIGKGRRETDEIARILSGTSGVRTAAPAPAGGLHLTEVAYA